MNIREQIEEREALLLSPYAAKSRDAIRDIEETPDPLRTAFQRDRDRIIHSKCFRRLKHKTQVYIAPGDHYRTRICTRMFPTIPTRKEVNSCHLLFRVADRIRRWFLQGHCSDNCCHSASLRTFPILLPSRQVVSQTPLLAQP